jgi:large subunit ribosomal protein L19
MAGTLLQKIDQEQRGGISIPDFRVGDNVRVHVKIREGDKERVQAFAGTVIARDGDGAGETFTVRRISYGEGVERMFPLYCRSIDRIEIERRGRVRRAKLYYLRGRVGKATRVKEEEQHKAAPTVALAPAGT